MKSLLWSVFLILTLAVTGCGGGGGGSSGSSSGSGNSAPVIETQPVSQSTVSGSSITLSVTATGNGLSYQWQNSTNAGATWADVADATAASYTLSAITAAMNGWQYRVTITSGTTSVESSAVTLTVASPTVPSITVQPANTQAVAGTGASFNVTAGGTSLTYQWQISTDGSTWANVSGATAATYKLATVALSDSGHQFRVEVSNSAGSITSNPALLTVTAASAKPTITTQPAASVSVVTGQSATFTVVASGDPTLTYQWQSSSDGGATFANISGATAASYTTPATAVSDSGKRFRVLVSNSAGNLTSSVATLTVTAASAAPVITTQPANQSVTAPATATFTVAASGTPTPTYQWQVSADGGATFANINGATSASYTTSATATTDSGKQFKVTVTNSSGSIASIAAVLTVAAPASFTSLGGSPYAITIDSSGVLWVLLAQPSNPTGSDATGGVLIQSVSASGSVATLTDSITQGSLTGLPQGIAVDSAGNVYVADSNNSVIRKVSPTGVASTFAGSGSFGNADGTGVAASFYLPSGLSMDSGRNIYVDDYGNHAIRKVTSAAVVTTLATNIAPACVAADAAGNVYFVDNTGAVLKLDTTGVITTLASSAVSVISAAGITVDSAGNLYIADAYNSVIRKVTPAGLVTTLAGSGSLGFVDATGAAASFSEPKGVAVDSGGNVFVADYGNHAIRKITPAGVVTTLVQ